MIGVEFAHHDGKPDASFRDRVMTTSFDKGLLLLSCGESTIRFCPPLIVKHDEVNSAVGIFNAVLTELG
jgi:4-aminobutyrate aminotransferase